MALVELRELKQHLQDLLGKGFIKSSMFPWESDVLFMKKNGGSLKMHIDY